MVYVDYRGKHEKRAASIQGRECLRECIAWLQQQLEWMEQNDKQVLTVISLSDEDPER